MSYSWEPTSYLKVGLKVSAPSSKSNSTWPSSLARFNWHQSTTNYNRLTTVHWLPVSHRITFKLCLLTWKTLHTARPPYLSELITHYLPPRALRSSNTNLLARPTSITSNFTSRAFSVSAPSTWNSLPTHIRSLDKLSTFKRQLKSHLFQSTFAA